ncbi:uncharacterized protein LOC126176129 [Schistocerca cancellata]|uniref:uncharacterized protein LOC126176129 n=1 Tax=Schistocerca cancellata TaxID=274614 RepID=UPI002119142F|nr:uncharacterized protein LOC126176129 [Schistocerca cancellata]
MRLSPLATWNGRRATLGEATPPSGEARVPPRRWCRGLATSPLSGVRPQGPAAGASAPLPAAAALQNTAPPAGAATVPLAAAAATSAAKQLQHAAAAQTATRPRKRVLQLSAARNTRCHAASFRPLETSFEYLPSETGTSVQASSSHRTS